MNYIFHDMMYDTMEYYVDDILVKYKIREEHWNVLRKVFNYILKHNIRLNPKKCVFNIMSGKLLGFIVSKGGIKIEPKKVKAIVNMPPPHNINTLRSLQGKIQAIRCFIAQISNKYHPFNELLKKSMVFELNEKCQQDIDDIKHYLTTPHILIPPRDALPFYLYLSMIDFALGVMLAQKNDQGSSLDINLSNEDIFRIDKEEESIDTHQTFYMTMYF